MSYILKTPAERGVIYCRNLDALIGEMETVLRAFDENGERPEDAILDSSWQVAPLECNHGVFRPANTIVSVVRTENGWHLE